MGESDLYRLLVLAQGGRVVEGAYKEDRTALLWIRVNDLVGTLTLHQSLAIHQERFRRHSQRELEQDRKAGDELVNQLQIPASVLGNIQPTCPVLETFDVTLSNMRPMALPDCTLISPPFPETHPCFADSNFRSRLLMSMFHG